MVIPLHAPSSVLPGLLLLQADNWDSNNEMGRVEKYKEALTLTTAAIDNGRGDPGLLPDFVKVKVGGRSGDAVVGVAAVIGVVFPKCLFPPLHI